MGKKWIIVTIIGLFILILAAAAGPIMSRVEQPQYQVIKEDKNIEIREYQPMIIAKVSIQAQRKEAIGKGFRLLAGYIFGKNAEDKQISMTAPVEQKPDNNSWKISFVMPKKFTLSSLPKPKAEEISFEEIPTKRFIVIVFSGRNNDKNIKKNEEKLLDYIEKNHIKTTKTPKYSFYNPPWTLPIFRRNEIMLELQE